MLPANIPRPSNLAIFTGEEILSVSPGGAMSRVFRCLVGVTRKRCDVNIRLIHVLLRR